MLTLIDAAATKRRYQRQLATELRSQLGSLGRRLVTFRPAQAMMRLYGPGQERLYFAPEFQLDREVFWNAFGLFDENRTAQEIVVEINISVGVRSTAGFFARDASGRVFLMHTGRIGGGRAGIGQAAFLAWLKPELIEVYSECGAGTTSIMVAELGNPRLATRIEAFVRSIAAFKAFVSSGGAQAAKFREEAERWRGYRKEFSGRKRANYAVDLDYVSYHGDVVDSLRTWVEERVPIGSAVTNSPLIDLLVHRQQTLKQVYEVKTGGDRQMLYAGLGQLIVHAGAGSDVERWFVLPEDVAIPNDIAAALEQNAISLLRFRIGDDDHVSIVG